MMYVQLTAQALLTDAAMLAAVVIALACRAALRQPVWPVVRLIPAFVARTVYARPVFRYPRALAMPVAERASALQLVDLSRNSLATVSASHQRFSAVPTWRTFAKIRARQKQVFTGPTTARMLVSTRPRFFTGKGFAATSTCQLARFCGVLARSATKLALAFRDRARSVVLYLAAYATCNSLHNKTPSRRAGGLFGTCHAPRRGVLSIPHTGMDIAGSEHLYDTTNGPRWQPFSALGGGKWLLP